MYAKIINGDALPAHFKLWYQMFAGWNEKNRADAPKRIFKKVEIEIVEKSL
jgi:hypothetical protein